MNKNGFICVLDSGIGGITVLSELIKLMPKESYMYFGDTKNAPYGEKTTEEVRNITLANIEALIQNGAKAIVIACNTATGAAAKEARGKHPHIPIIGIEPAIKPAVTAHKGKEVIIMATPLTLKQEKFDILYHKWNTVAQTELLPCPGLATLIEKGNVDDDEIRVYLKELFAKTYTPPAAIVLGCTHYPIIKSRIKERFPSAEIFDGGEGTARQTKRLLEDQNLITDSLQGNIEIITSLDQEKTREFKNKVLSILPRLVKE